MPQKCLLPSTSCKGSLGCPAHILTSLQETSAFGLRNPNYYTSTPVAEHPLSFCVHVLGFQVTQQAVMHTVTFSYTHLLLGVCR